MSGPLSGSVAVVTGATSGIGTATAAALAARGARVAAVGRSREKLAEVSAILERDGASVAAIHCDLADPVAVGRVVPSVLSELGRLDILINCAGYGSPDDLLTTSMEAWRASIEVNLTAPFALMQAAAAVMVERGVAGRIVNVLSSSVYRAVFSPPAYVSAKGGLEALTRSAAGTLGASGIGVNAVAPGLTATSMSFSTFGTREAIDQAAREGPLANLFGRPSEPEDIAEVIAFLCSPESRQITGQVIHVSAGAVV